MTSPQAVPRSSDSPARSVQFQSPPSPKTNPSRPHASSPNGGGGGGGSGSGQTGESSADEITPIISHQRNNRRYDSTTPPNPPSKNDTTNAQTSSTTSTARKRKKSNRRISRSSEVEGGDNGDGEEGADEAEEAEGGGREPKPHNRLLRWAQDTLEKYGSIELDNKGSVARDHLALERTFLAWLRTSLAFASIGIAITQLFRLNTTIEQREGFKPVNPPNTYHLRQVGKPLGATFLGIAIVVLMVGGRRYFESQYWIIRGKFPASRGSVFLITAIAALLIVASLVVVCVVDPSVFEKRR